jgi:hypothetical protein
MQQSPSHRPLTDAELAEISGIGGAGISGRGRLRGEIHVESHVVELITSGKGTRSQVSFTLDLSARKARHLEGHEVAVSGFVQKTSPWSGSITHARVVARPTAHHLPGDHLSLSGKIDNRSPIGPGGEAPPAGSYLVLSEPLRVGASTAAEVFLEGRDFEQGRAVTVHGRLEERTWGGVETGNHPYVALSGVSDVGAGEPLFDGVQLTSAKSGAPLRVLVVRRNDLFDAPNAIVVLDPAQGRAFWGSFGGHIRPDANPFHGFSAAAEIAAPTDADRAAVVFDKDGNAIDAGTGERLLKVGEELPPPGTADMFAYGWYYEDTKETVYGFVSGGIAGFVNRMQSVIRFAV